MHKFTTFEIYEMKIDNGKVFTAVVLRKTCEITAERFPPHCIPVMNTMLSKRKIKGKCTPGALSIKCNR